MSRSEPSFAERQRPTTISSAECQAMRALDGDDEYSRQEIAFMFGCDPRTVSRHVDAPCYHDRRPDIDANDAAAEEFLDRVRFWEGEP
jgi:hypothetical protein